MVTFEFHSHFPVTLESKVEVMEHRVRTSTTHETLALVDHNLTYPHLLENLESKVTPHWRPTHDQYVVRIVVHFQSVATLGTEVLLVVSPEPRGPQIYSTVVLDPTLAQVRRHVTSTSTHLEDVFVFEVVSQVVGVFRGQNEPRVVTHVGFTLLVVVLDLVEDVVEFPKVRVLELLPFLLRHQWEWFIELFWYTRLLDGSYLHTCSP
ncbi:hypothetical protein D3C78_1411440 [compost metagenome]